MIPNFRSRLCDRHYLGFAVGNGNTLWVVSNNPAVIRLHVVLAIVMLYLGFGASGSKATV